MMKMKAVVVGDTVLLMDLVAIPGVKNAKQWIEVSRAPVGDFPDTQAVEEYERYLEDKFRGNIKFKFVSDFSDNTEGRWEVEQD